MSWLPVAVCNLLSFFRSYFNGELFLAPRPTQKVENYSSLALRGCLFAPVLRISRRSPPLAEKDLACCAKAVEWDSADDCLSDICGCNCSGYTEYSLLEFCAVMSGRDV